MQRRERAPTGLAELADAVALEAFEQDARAVAGMKGAREAQAEAAELLLRQVCTKQSLAKLMTALALNLIKARWLWRQTFLEWTQALRAQLHAANAQCHFTSGPNAENMARAGAVIWELVVKGEPLKDVVAKARTVDRLLAATVFCSTTCEEKHSSWSHRVTQQQHPQYQELLMRAPQQHVLRELEAHQAAPTQPAAKRLCMMGTGGAGSSINGHQHLQQQARADSMACSSSRQCSRNAREVQLSCSRQMHDLELQVQEAVRQAQGADRDRQRLEAAVAAAEAKASAAERRAADAESEMLLLGRSLRDAESAVVEWQVRARQAEECRQELSQMMASSEAAVKQVQADLAQMQITHSSDRAHAATQQQQVAAQQLERAASDAQAARAEAERRLRDTERQLTDMRAALDSQERLLLVLREQVAEGGAAAARVGHLEAAVQALEASLSDARHTISQLRSAAVSSEHESQATTSSLLSELAAKNSQLVDAERRFSELEALLQRIASRTGQSLSPLRQSMGSALWEQHYHGQQQPLSSASLKGSWGAFGFSNSRCVQATAGGSQQCYNQNAPASSLPSTKPTAVLSRQRYDRV